MCSSVTSSSFLDLNTAVRAMPFEPTPALTCKHEAVRKKGKIIRGIDKSPRPRIALHHRFIEYKQEVETKMVF